jgi:hypothetical protein
VHARVANLVNALTGRERLQVDLGSQDGYFIIVKQRKKWNMF